MFSVFWIGWALFGLSAATVLFAWAIKTRQFENSRRAALLPFDDISPAKPNEKTGSGRMLFITIVAVFALSIGLLIFTLTFIF